MIAGLWIENDREANIHGLIEIIILYFAGRINTTKDLGQNSRRSGQDPSRNPAEYKL
jgi:hypothetical protein